MAFVEGEVVRCGEGEVVLNCGGVGLRVMVPESTRERLSVSGQRVRLWTVLELYHGPGGRIETLLFGFLTEAESLLFELLRSVSGIGSKTALALLSAASVAELRENILRGDVAALRRLPGLGRKTAERVVLELQERIRQLELDDRGGLPSLVRREALSALMALGYSRGEAERMLRSALEQHGAEQIRTTEELLRIALRHAQR